MTREKLSLHRASEERAGLVGIVNGLARLLDETDTVTFGDLLNALGARGHGPIILILAVFMMLPTGMLPFMPSIVGFFLAIAACQMIVGGKGVSVPQRLARIELDRDAFRAALQKARPVLERLLPRLNPRFAILTENGLALGLMALSLFVLSITMMVIGAVPGLPFVLCVPVFLFGLGLTAGDGLFVALGFGATVLAAIVVLRMRDLAVGLLPFLH